MLDDTSGDGGRKATTTGADPSQSGSQRGSRPSRSLKERRRGGVFISYRRSDSMSASGRIYERLARRYGKAHVFKDIDSIPAGEDFAHVIGDTIARSAVTLVIIGHDWADSRDEQGLRRLDNPNDWVRREVEAALAEDLPVVPVLVEGAHMPKAEQLPASLARLAALNAVPVNNDPDFESGLHRLGKQVDSLLAPGLRPAVRKRRAIGTAMTSLCVVALLGVVLRPILFPPPPPPQPYAGAQTTADRLDQVVTDSSGGLWALGTHYDGDLSSFGSHEQSSMLLHYTGHAWVYGAPLPRGVFVHALAMVSPTEGWAVGENGAIVHYKSGTWTAVQSPTQATLNSIAMVSPDEGWAVGDKGIILQYAHGVWSAATSTTSQTLYSVTMLSADEGWAGGANQTILHYVNNSWTLVPVQHALSGFDARAIAALSSTEAWAVGTSGVLLHYTVSPGATTGTWMQVIPSGTAFLTTTLFSISMANANEGWAVGDQGTVLHYASGAWSSVSGVASVRLSSIVAVSATDGWAVGDKGTILRYTVGANGGWAQSPTGAGDSAYLVTVSMASPSDGWAVGYTNPVGDSGIMLHYTGGQWQTVSRNTLPILYTVDMLSASDGWTVGYAGTILHYSGGAWTTVASPTTDDLLSVAMISPDEGWAVGNNGVILHYNSGAWTTVASPTTARLRNVRMISPDEGWAVGYSGAILHYSGGAWTKVASPTMENVFDVAMASAADGWAVGDHGTILRYTGGAWTPWTQPNPPTNQLIYSATMISPSEGWAVGYGGTILHYAGGAWVKIANSNTANLYRVTMVSPSEGWASGANGTILHYVPATWTTVNGPAQ